MEYTTGHFNREKQERGCTYKTQFMKLSATDRDWRFELETLDCQHEVFVNVVQISYFSTKLALRVIDAQTRETKWKCDSVKITMIDGRET